MNYTEVKKNCHKSSKNFFLEQSHPRILVATLQVDVGETGSAGLTPSGALNLSGGSSMKNVAAKCSCYYCI